MRIKIRHFFSTKDQPLVYNYTKSKLGKNVRISAEVYFDVINPHLIQIDDHCVIGMRTSLLTHGPISTKRNIHIHHHVWIGYSTLILPGCEIASHTIIGAGSVVTKSFHEEGIIIAGNPARKIRNLTDKEIDVLIFHLENIVPMGKEGSNE